jgi:catalase-peroxidase
VRLISCFTRRAGGGHAFGKTHGACPLGPGPSPLADPSNPWPGLCPNGVYTSGFEGPWTTEPLTWSNQYFKNLLRFNWKIDNSPGNHKQFKAQDGPSEIMMLVTDLSLTQHDFFKVHVEEFANNLSSLSHEFAIAWCCDPTPNIRTVFAY